MKKYLVFMVCVLFSISVGSCKGKESNSSNPLKTLELNEKGYSASSSSNPGDTAPTVPASPGVLTTTPADATVPTSPSVPLFVATKVVFNKSDSLELHHILNENENGSKFVLMHYDCRGTGKSLIYAIDKDGKNHSLGNFNGNDVNATFSITNQNVTIAYDSKTKTLKFNDSLKF
jgi:hypothetical protein